MLIATVGGNVVLQVPDAAPAAAGGAATAGLQLLHDMQKLPPPRQRKQLSSTRFWQEVQHTLLPTLNALIASTAGMEPTMQPLDGLESGRALATRVCTNPGCLKIRGCSEGRLRSRRCSGCGVARYCCHACQLADFWAHRKVCPMLAAEARS